MNLKEINESLNLGNVVKLSESCSLQYNKPRLDKLSDLQNMYKRTWSSSITIVTNSISYTYILTYQGMNNCSIFKYCITLPDNSTKNIILKVDNKNRKLSQGMFKRLLYYLNSEDSMGEVLRTMGLNMQCFIDYEADIIAYIKDIRKIVIGFFILYFTEDWEFLCIGYKDIECIEFLPYSYFVNLGFQVIDTHFKASDNSNLVLFNYDMSSGLSKNILYMTDDFKDFMTNKLLVKFGKVKLLGLGSSFCINFK